MKQKLIVGAVALSLVVGTSVYAATKTATTTGYYESGGVCRTITLSASNFNTQGSGSPAQIRTEGNLTPAPLYSSRNIDLTCNTSDPIYFND